MSDGCGAQRINIAVHHEREGGGLEWRGWEGSLAKQLGTAAAAPWELSRRGAAPPSERSRHAFRLLAWGPALPPH